MDNLPIIVETDFLKTLIGQPSILIVDIRAIEFYKQGHIAGAVHFDISQLNASTPPTNGLLPETNDFNVAMSAIGLNKDTHVIVYDDAGGPPAGRFVWTLHAFGHENCSMLNGGIQAWTADNNSIESNTVTLQTTNYQTKLIGNNVATRDYILSKLDDNNVLLLDNRTAAEYRGDDIRSAQGGHIPGAVHLNWMDTKDLSRNMRFKPDATLEEILKKLGATPEKEIITYCQTHQRSALIWVMLKALGYKKIKGYPGAWSDWGNRGNLPIES